MRVTLRATMSRWMFNLVLLVALVACQESYTVGDKVLVEWEGNNYPAVITKLDGHKYVVHFEGYEDSWDEVVARDRLKGLIEGDVVHPDPPPKVVAKAVKSAQSNRYKIGDRVRVEWHGELYPAQITQIIGKETYRIHYENYGTEWDETVGLTRIQPR